MKLLELTQNKFVMLDDEDFIELSKVKWQYKNGYAVRSIRINKNKTDLLMMHRVILNAQPDELVDHRDLDRLNCQRYNLRKCTRTQNQYNRTKQQNKIGYKGVYYRIDEDKYLVKIGVNNKSIYIGHYKTEEEAAIAYNNAAILYHGEFANLNIIN